MYTDHIGQPITVGSRIAYPDQRGSLNLANVHALIPLVPHPDPHRWSKDALCREDQLKGSRRPTEFAGRYYSDPAKRYVVQILKPKHSGYERDEDGTPHRVLRDTKYTLPTNQVVVLPDDAEVK